MPKPLEEGSTLSSEHEMESYRTQVAILNESLNVKRVLLLWSIACSRIPSLILSSGTLAHRGYSLQHLQWSRSHQSCTQPQESSRPLILVVGNPSRMQLCSLPNRNPFVANMQHKLFRSILHAALVPVDGA